MANETLAQGFELFVRDRLTNPSVPVVRKIGNITNLGEFGGTADDLETTNLDSKAKEFVRGLADNGEMSLQINVARNDLGHKFMWKAHKMTPAQGDPRFEFIICDSTGTDLPTLDTSDGFDPPADREWFSFLASVKSFRMPVGVNTVVNATTALRISGEITSSWDD
ncbi:phage tail tube protein [Dokdonella sp. MW10]|uniref:phage tail tube protein n=1 Tax=Dokdonella sp. MW10 TaxID=2992926 RepID=UPI003F7D68F4